MYEQKSHQTKDKYYLAALEAKPYEKDETKICLVESAVIYIILKLKF